MSYNRGAIKIEGLKGTRIEFPKLHPDRPYCTPGGIRTAGPARVLGTGSRLTSRKKSETVKQEPEEGEERSE